MALFFVAPYTGTEASDYIVSRAFINSDPATHILNGLGGDDIINTEAGAFFGSSPPGTSAGTATNLSATDLVWSLTDYPGIAFPTSLTHTTVYAEGDGTNTHWFRVTMFAGETIFVDMDHGRRPGQTLDGEITIYASDFTTVLANVDDSQSPLDGAGSTNTDRDPFVAFTALTAGDYYIQVADFDDDPIPAGEFYLLNISSTERTATANPLGTFNDTIFGGAGNDTIFAGRGDDRLNGGADGDDMFGGDGDDWYFVDNDQDRVFERIDQGDADRVSTSVTYVLAADQEIELFTTTSSTGTNALSLTGNRQSQSIVGNDGANTLSDGGGPGVDQLLGRGGNDIYIVRNVNTTITESSGGGTADRVTAGVDFRLASDDNIEQMRTVNSGATTGIDLTGNALSQTMIGNAGDNSLNGGAGNDTMTGSGGADRFVFSTALASSNVDRITDFTSADFIVLDDAVFTGLATGALAASRFIASASGLATTSAHRVTYDTTSGELFFDADGNASGARVRVAILEGAPTLTAADILVI
jgi:Ca2+-binding RTX toxin-like protein